MWACGSTSLLPAISPCQSNKQTHVQDTCAVTRHTAISSAVRLAYMHVMPASLVPLLPNPNPPLVLTVPAYIPCYLCSHKTVFILIEYLGAMHATARACNSP